MKRLIYSILLLLPLCQIAYTAEPTCRFGQQRLFFPETQVALLFNCYDKPQVDWSLESADRKIMSGIARVRDGIGTVEFKTPPLKSGVTLKLTLTVDGKTEPFILVSPDVFADQQKWLESLNIVLIDDDDGKVASIFESEDIPFKTTVDETTENALILVTNGELSNKWVWNTYLQSHNVIIVAPKTGDCELQLWGDFEFTITNRVRSLFKNKAKQQDQELAGGVFYDIQTYNVPQFVLGLKDDRRVAVLRTISPSDIPGEWRCLYADHYYSTAIRSRLGTRISSGRSLFITTPIFDHWETSPAARLFLKMLFEELETKETE